MRQFLIVYEDDVYMQDATSYDEALDLLAADLEVSRDDLVLECRALETERRQIEASGIN